MEQLFDANQSGTLGAKGPSELAACSAGLLCPACFLLLLLILLCRRRSSASEIIDASERSCQRLECGQSGELLKAAALLRLHKMLDPCVAVRDLLLAQLSGNALHRLSRLDGAGLSSASAVGLPSNESFCEGPDHLDRLQIADVGRRVEQLVASIIHQLLRHSGVDLRMGGEMLLHSGLQLGQRRTACCSACIRTELAGRNASSAVDDDALHSALAKEVCELTLLLVAG